MEFFGLDLPLWIVLAAASLLLCAVVLLLYTWHCRVLSRQQHYYQKILNNMLDGFVLHGSDGKIVQFNAAAPRILQMTADQLRGASSHDPHWQATREDGSEFSPVDHPAMKTLSTGETLENVIMGISSSVSAEKRWISINSVALFSRNQQQPSGAVATFKDVTESRLLQEEITKTKQRLELAVMTANLGVWDWNISSGDLHWSVEMFKIFGISAENFSHNYEAWYNSIVPEDRSVAVAELQASVAAESELQSTYRILKPDGEVRHLRAVGRIFKDHQGKACHMIGVNWDVTSQVENIRILQQAREEAEIGSRTKNEFLANMGHEIRTPLNGIFGMLGLLKDTKMNEEQADLLATAESCSENLLAILNDLLDFNRIEAGRLTLDYEPFDVHASVIDVVKLMSSLAHKKGLRIVTDVVPDLPVMNLGDESRFRQVLVNLMSNAIKFTHHGEIKVRVDGYRGSQNKFAFRISVQDTGIGISRENQAKIFQAFSQADTSMTRRFGGTGLGLAISSRLAQLMGGTLGLQSEAGQGSCFTLAVSLEIVSQQKNQQVPQPAAETDPGRRILVVEDNIVNQTVVISLLRKMGFAAVDIAGDGLAALFLLETNSYEVILMDLHMPVMDGTTATQKIRQRRDGQAIKIIAMTANAFEEDKQKCLAAGMDDYLCKPFTRKDLERVLGIDTSVKVS